MIAPPVLPEPAGPNPARATFYREAAGAFEFLALWHSLTEAEQTDLRDAIEVAATRAAQRAVKQEKRK